MRSRKKAARVDLTLSLSLSTSGAIQNGDQTLPLISSLCYINNVFFSFKKNPFRLPVRFTKDDGRDETPVVWR